MKMNTAKLFLFLFSFFALTESFSIEEKGRQYSEEEEEQYRVYFKDKDDIISSWHDIPLYDKDDFSNQTYNMVVEIPRFSHAKFEISRDLKLNPIVHDQKNGANRYLPNVFPWHGHVCNYGAFPQTWENPFVEDVWTGLSGDKDPIDVCEVGSSPFPTGTVVPVRVLGILGLLDSAETDWKVIVINAEEARAKNINTLEDLNIASPNIANTVREFFRYYKVPSGNPENKFAFDGEIRDQEFALDVLRQTHLEWQLLIHNCTVSGPEVGSFSTANTKQGTECSISQESAMRELMLAADHNPVPAPRPDNVDTWSFVQRSSSSGAREGLAMRLLMGVLMMAVVF